MTIAATAPATVPTGVTVSDFDVTEMAGTTALTPARIDFNPATNVLTITPNATATADSEVTVSAASASLNITLAVPVTVAVDRTAPVVAITTPTTNPTANTATTVTIAVTGAAAGEAIEVGDIAVTQTLADGTAKALSHTYNAGTVTFTPDAMSTVDVKVNAGVVEDDVGNKNLEASEPITVEAQGTPAAPQQFGSHSGGKKRYLDVGSDRRFDL